MSERIAYEVRYRLSDGRRERRVLYSLKEAFSYATAFNGKVLRVYVKSDCQVWRNGSPRR